MLKKSIVIASAFLFLFVSCFVSSAETDTMPQPQIYLDGEEIGNSLSRMYFYQIPYAAVARKLGYQVAYHEDTREVTAVKEGKNVTVKIGSRIASVQEEESIPVMLRIQAIEENGVTYLSIRDLETLLELQAFFRYEDMTLHFYDTTRYVAYLQDHCKAFLDYIASTDIPSDFYSSSQSSLSFQADSGLFGIHLKGSSDISMNLQKQGTAIAAEFEMKSDGLFHFYHLLLNPAVTTQMKYFNDKVDLAKPIKARIYLDKDAMYLDSETAAPLIIYQDYMGSSAEKLEKAFSSAKDGRIKIGISEDEYVRELMEPFFTMLEYGTYLPQKEEFVESLAKSMIQYNGSKGYDSVMRGFQLLEKLTGEPYFLIQRTEKETAITYQIKAKDLQNLLETLGFAEENEQLIQYLNCDVTITAVHTKSGSIDSKNDYKIKLSNLPNPYGLEIGSVELSVQEERHQKAENQKMEKPNEDGYVDYNEIDKIMKASDRN